MLYENQLERISSGLKVLVDSKRDGIDLQLKSLGYEAFSVNGLCEKGLKLYTDYSIIKYAEKNRMVLVTDKVDNVYGCIENRIEHVMFGQSQTLQYLIAELENIENAVELRNKIC